MLQLNRICVKFYIILKEPQPLTYYNGWFSGLVDSDGSIHIDEKSRQLIISVTQKNKYLLEPLPRKICMEEELRFWYLKKGFNILFIENKSLN